MKQHLPALTGVRFLAVFHIFLHHLWAVFTYVRDTKPGTESLLNDMTNIPQSIMVFLANGWVSTSLFFLLSGFILAHLYWQPNGRFRGSPQHFLIVRLARIYPVHLIALVPLLINAYHVHIEDGYSLAFITSSAIGTALLIQAWVPSWIPMWNWPAWTISVMVTLYLLMPFIIHGLNKLTKRQQHFSLLVLPLVSLIPTAFYARQLWTGMPWTMQTEIFYSNFPLFWVPYFVAGMLLTRIISVAENAKSDSKPVIALGDIAFILAISFAMVPDLFQPMTSFIRFGLLMPIYMVFVADLARGRGFVARLLSYRAFHYLGEISFSIFIWQSVVIAALFISLSIYPPIADYHFSIAIVSILLIAIGSLHWIERPISQWTKRKLKASHD